LSNFDPGRFTDLAAYNHIIPAVNQLQTNVFSQQVEQEKFLKQYNTKIIAWSPLTQGNVDFFKNPLLVEIASKYQKAVAQIALRWLIQRGIIVIPKSTHRNRMEQNLDIFGFELSDEDMSRIANLNQKDSGSVNFDDPAFIKWLTETYK